MMIFREHWVLSMYALSFVFGIFFSSLFPFGTV